jgi:hypothetical protein
MTTEERIAAIRADLNGASGVSRNGERIRSAHAHLDAIQARLHSLTAAGQVAADAITAAEHCIDGAHAGQHSFLPGQYRTWKRARLDALSLLSREGITPGGG